MRLPFGFTRVIAVALGLFVLGGVVATGQKSDEAFRKMYRELRQRMDDDISEAAKYLEAQIAASPDSADVNVLRHSLATKLFEQRDYKAANEQFQKLIAFQANHVDQSENQYGLWMTVQSMQEIADQSGDSDELKKAVQRGLDALASVDPQSQLQPLVPISQLVVLSSQFMVDDGKVDEAKELIGGQLDKLVEINNSDDATADTMQALVRMLRALTTSDRCNDDWRDESVAKLEKVVSNAIERYPDSQLLQNDYAETQLMMITRWGQDDPEATKERIDTAIKKLDLFAVKNRSVLATLRRITLHKQRMSAVKPVESLVGKPAPPWDVDAWVNVIEMEKADLDGKVVLLDFWAMWCGPCVATFPHLRQWREEFADQEFEIVGVTQYYNYAWDDEQKRASRSKADVTPEEERRTLASFLDHYKLSHPVIVTPDGSEMGSNYGVRGIPHVVLIDRKGVVQLVKTGAGEATAKQIHAKIKELVEPAEEQ